MTFANALRWAPEILQIKYQYKALVCNSVGHRVSYRVRVFQHDSEVNSPHRLARGTSSQANRRASLNSL